MQYNVKRNFTTSAPPPKKMFIYASDLHWRAQKFSSYQIFKYSELALNIRQFSSEIINVLK